jgi:hypothetical protein
VRPGIDLAIPNDERWSMKITFVGGPLDGQVEEVDITGAGKEVIYWPPGTREETSPEGHARVREGLFEYLSRGDGSAKADYVAGIPKDSAGEPSSYL